ncbi:MAG: hypothetical protein QXW42_04120 [Thermofilum sp.]
MREQGVFMDYSEILRNTLSKFEDIKFEHKEFERRVVRLFDDDVVEGVKQLSAKHNVTDNDVIRGLLEHYIQQLKEVEALCGQKNTDRRILTK